MTQTTWPNTSSNTVSTFLSSIGVLNTLLAYVIPNYLNNLEVVTASPTVGAVLVKSGAAFCSPVGAATTDGVYFYTNDSDVSVAITSAANNRIDRIVLRNSRVTKIIGVEGAVPAMPALSAGDLALAWIYVPSGYNAATTAITDSWIQDERMFSLSGSEPIDYNKHNIMHNFEFMAYARGGVTTSPPEMWKLSGAAITTCGPFTTINTTRNFSNRSQGITMTNTPNNGIFTTIPLPNKGARTYTLRFCHQKTDSTTSTMEISSRILGGAASSTKTVTLYRINGDPIQDCIVRYTTTSTATAIDIKLYSAAATVVNISPILITEGLCTTYNFPRKTEILFMDRVLQDASWNATAKSSGTTAINLNTSFGANIRRGTIAIIATIKANDSGSAATATNSLFLGAKGNYSTAIGETTHVGLIPNDYLRSQVGYIPIDYNTATIPISAIVTASGVGTLDATLEIVGIII